MAGRTIGKFAVRTKGLTKEQAADLAYLINSAVHAYAGEGNYDFACNVRVPRLRGRFPDGRWRPVTGEERAKLVR
jgi:hypothetical protein